jgi:ubiquinone/menaquinone biosynthesis C-methylase UbiE
VSTITEPHQSPPVPGLSLRLPHTATAGAVDTGCQLCAGVGVEPLIDLGHAPLNAHVGDNADEDTTTVRPLRVVRCIRCGALQLGHELDADDRAVVAAAVGERAFAGRPDLARRFCEDAIDRWGLRGDGHVVEIGSGTGSLLRFFRAWQLPVLGIESDRCLTRYARLRRIPTWRAGFDTAIAGRIARADMHADLLIISTPTGGFADLRQLFADAATILRPGGVMTLEVSDVLRVVARTRFDEVAHAHRVIPTIGQLQRTVAAFGCELIDVERAEPDQARLRLWIQRTHEHGATSVHPRVRTRLRAEEAVAIDEPTTTAAFARRVRLIREQIVSLLDDARLQHCTVACSGATPSAVALANMVGMKRSDVAYVVDPVRCGTTMPGTDVPVISPDQASAWRPDLVLVLDDLPESPDAWESAPVYAVSDLIDVVHRLTGAMAPADADDTSASRRQLRPELVR